MFSGRMNTSETLAIEENYQRFLINGERKVKKLFFFEKNHLQDDISKNENGYNNGRDDLQKIIICKNGKLSA